MLKDHLGPANATLALTAYAGAGDRKRALEAGFRDLAKPVNPNVLLQTLEDPLATRTRRPSRARPPIHTDQALVNICV